MSPRLLALAAAGAALALAGCAGNARATTPGYDDVARDNGPHRFVDVAADVGLDFRHGAFNWEAGADAVAMMGGGLCWLDYNRDGYSDFLLPQIGQNAWSIHVSNGETFESPSEPMFHFHRSHDDVDEAKENLARDDGRVVARPQLDMGSLRQRRKHARQEAELPHVPQSLTCGRRKWSCACHLRRYSKSCGCLPSSEINNKTVYHEMI